MKKAKIFYSWQSERGETRNYIEKHLKRAIKTIANSPDLVVRPEFDRDTLGAKGAPDILDTIKGKISKCDILAADLSIIGSVDKKNMVNQNVMFEVGYMIGSNRADRLILLFNTDYGNLKDAPFDISHHRIMAFSIEEDKKGAVFEEKLRKIIIDHLTKEDEEQGNPDLLKSLNAKEKKIMRLFASLQDEYRILIVGTMGGSIIRPCEPYSVELFDSTIDDIGEIRVIAIMKELANRGILNMGTGSKGTLNFTPSATGFDVIDAIRENDKNKK